jgi:hypothetical protein
MAICVDHSDASNTCTCPAGYAGDGFGANGCVPIDTCSGSNGCQNGGTCTSSGSGPVCSCPQGFAGAHCELELCDTLTVRSKADLDSARACAEIHGNLSLLGGASAITASDLPNLKRITGDLTITTFGAQQPFIESVTLSALQSVEGGVYIAGNARTRTVSLPALRSIGKSGSMSKFQVQQAVLSRLDLPQLATIYADVTIAQANGLCAVNMPALSSVSGNVDLLDLPNVGYSAFAKLRMSSGGTVSGRNVGCCTISDSFSCDSEPSWECTSSCP